MLADDLVRVLACPKSHKPLVYFPRGERDDGSDAGFLLCPSSRLRYRIDGGVPVMLVEEAEELTAARVDSLVARARELGLPVPT